MQAEPDDFEHDDHDSTSAKRDHRLRLATNRLDTQPAEVEARYVCDSCGEEIVVPIDVTEGRHQDYVEDCPVCCNPMVLHVEIADDGEPLIRSEHE